MRRLVLSIMSLASMVAMSAGVCSADVMSDLQQAKGLYQSGDFDGALKLLDGSVSTDSATSAEALKIVGNCHLSKADVAKALESYKKLTDTYPDSTSTTQSVKDYVIGLKYHLGADTDSDISYSRLMAAKYPDDALMWGYFTGCSLKSKGMESEALVEFLKAWDQPTIKTNREWESKLTFQIDTTQMFSNFDKMIETAKTAAAQPSKDRMYWQYLLGYGYLCKGNFPNAITELGKAAEISSPSDAGTARPGNSQRTIKYMLGYTYEKNQQYDKALVVYREVAAKYPEYLKAHTGIFTCLINQDKIEEASAYLNKVSVEQPAIRDRLRKVMMDYLLNEGDKPAK